MIKALERIGCSSTERNNAHATDDGARDQHSNCMFWYTIITRHRGNRLRRKG
jgi:hypothetical protein